MLIIQMTQRLEIDIEKELSPRRRTAAECREVFAKNRAWGEIFSDHMVTGFFTQQQGWHGLKVCPFGTFELHPATAALHYGQAIFEGLKAYHQPDGAIMAFRAEMNAKRFARSAERLAMPPLPEELFLASLRALVEVDRAWTPENYGESLYLRPLMFSTDERLMTGPSRTYRYVVMAAPVADYFPNGIKPVSVWISSEYVRAVRGGVGEAKCAGNYAASFLAQREAATNGCEQVVWLDAIDRETVEEMGGMNVFMVFDRGGKPVLGTPKASGSLLKGVTRDTLLTLAGDLGYAAEERRITFDEWKSGCESGEITEAFACGTAAVITPIGQVKSDKGAFSVADGNTGKVTTNLRRALLDIQHGRSADRHGWRYQLAPLL
jgi:branched-chain amino acid aminotransferase